MQGANIKGEWYGHGEFEYGDVQLKTAVAPLDWEGVFSCRLIVVGTDLLLKWRRADFLPQGLSLGGRTTEWAFMVVLLMIGVERGAV